MSLPLLTACDGPLSTLSPAGPSARMAADLWWGMLLFSTVVLVAVVGVWIHALRRPHRTCDANRHRIEQRWIIGGGIILPTVSIAVLLAFGLTAGHRMLPLPLNGDPPLRINVTGHQWRFEVNYPDHGIRMENRLIIPAGQPVDIHVDSGDVIHSFWVPRLAGKIDMLPGRTNVLRLEADDPGTYRGQCAEFCGALHARMTLEVEALSDEGFDEWLEANRQ